MFYVEATKGQLSTNLCPTAEKLQELLVRITTGQANKNDVLIVTIMVFFTILLTHHD